ncbi:ATP-binding protein [Phytohalomonas tamaricis]|uniref:ATP-binding protein n=1 Tax=Phytohalomonas tamaricis TaxID=2081032 RepID=UPI000D0B4318|nr:ATP-binding protein [Phytohalomonas tamaricis]
MRSIRQYLIRRLLLILVLGSGLSLIAAYFITEHEMEEIFDAQLAQWARIVSSMLDENMSAADYRRLADRLTLPDHEARYYGMPGDSGEDQTLKRTVEPKRYISEERMLSMGIWNKDGSPRMISAKWNDAGVFPTPDGHRYRWVEYDGDRWRVFSMYDASEQIWISTGLREDFQHELASKIAMSNSIPDLFTLLFAALLIWLVIQRGLRPINALSHQVMQRHDQDLSLLAGDAPIELSGLQHALNAFLDRLRMALERERRFTADAAHELRTPLAALKIHLDNAQASEAQSRPSLIKARYGIERLQRVVEQLLTLARLERAPKTQMEAIDIYPIALQLASELWPLANARQQTLEMDGMTQLHVRANPIEVGVLLRNLIDNALRYTPDGGTIEIRLEHYEGRPSFCVLDDGPGIAADMIDRVTERFHRANEQRISGSGLGLAIVDELTRRQQATLMLINRTPHGLSARICWPTP